MQDHIIPECEFRWIENDHILMVVPKDISTRAKVDAYYNVLDEYIRTWPMGKPYLLYFDATQAALAGLPACYALVC